MAKKRYDVIISGAGPTGLAGAITAGRLGASYVVLEKGVKPSPEPRGESIAQYKVMDDLLGKDWLKHKSSNNPSFRRFHSPMDRKSSLIDVHKPYYFFHWDHLMKHMKTLAMEAGAEFLFRSEVTDLIETENRCTGLKYKDKQNSCCVMAPSSRNFCGENKGRRCHFYFPVARKNCQRNILYNIINLLIIYCKI